MRQYYGTDNPININAPGFNPIVKHKVFDDNTDRIRAEAKRDKTLPPSAPAELALAPDLLQGAVPLGSKKAKRPYYLGPIDDFSSEEDEF
jgi:hypothetical protein